MSGPTALLPGCEGADVCSGEVEGSAFGLGLWEQEGQSEAGGGGRRDDQQMHSCAEQLICLHLSLLHYVNNSVTAYQNCSVETH